MITDNLSDDNFVLLAMKAYDRPNAVMSEFEDDIKRIKYIKRLIKKYRMSKDIKERLILNHIIVLSNVFGIEHTVRMLFFKMDKTDYDVLKTFLIFLNFMPQVVHGIKNTSIHSSDITIDIHVGKKLRSL